MLLVVAVLALVANAGYNFIPVAYQGESFKQEMSTIVLNSVSLPSTHGKPTEVIKFRLATSAKNSSLPYETFIDVKQKNKILTARVYYKKTIPVLPFGAYDYQYVFDHTASPSGFLTQ